MTYAKGNCAKIRSLNHYKRGLVRTPHNTVILLRLARRACFSEVAYVTSKMLCLIPKTINHPSLPRTRRKRLNNSILFTNILLLTFLANCRENKMNDSTPPSTASKTADNDALSLHRRAIAIDMHADTAQRLVDEHVDLEHLLNDGHFDAVPAKGRLPLCLALKGVTPSTSAWKTSSATTNLAYVTCRLPGA